MSFKKAEDQLKKLQESLPKRIAQTLIYFISLTHCIFMYFCIFYLIIALIYHFSWQNIKKQEKT